MRTTFEVVDLLWSLLDASVLKSAITGKIVKSRPQNSAKEDVVLNSLPVSATQLQEGVMNVNIHVQNLVLNSNGTQDATQPNIPRLKALAAITEQLIADLTLDGGNILVYIENQAMFSEPEKNEHYVNFRLRYHCVNL